MSELSAQGVCFAYGDRERLLDDLCFSVRSGETVVIIGGNASGKTTLLRILAGMLHPSKGEVRLNAVPVSELRSRIGILFQNPDHQMIAATVEEEIALGLEFRGTERDVMRQIVKDTVQRFALEALKTRAPETLSGGQKQRVALAAIMALQPDFLLLDEPDSYLDAPSRRDLMHAIDEIRDVTGIVWTTSHPRRRPNADHFLLLENGKLLDAPESEWPLRFAAMPA